MPTSTFSQPRGGREELRALLLRPALARLRDEKGASTVTEVLYEAGLQEAELAHDSAWLSLPTAREVLTSIVARAGESALSHRGSHATDADVLGGYMRLLRQAETPKDGYEQLVAAALESSRVGRYTVLELGATSARVRYSPSDELDEDQTDRAFCLLRQGELRAIPQLWGLKEAELSECACLSTGARHCEYQLNWQPIAPNRTPLLSLTGGGLFGGAALLAGSTLGAALAAVSGALAGGAIGALLRYVARTTAERHRERCRIRALEQSLEQRGHLAPTASDLTHSVLGGKYRILRSVGSGGIGTVYAAEHLGLGFQVAVKVLRGAAAADAAEVARLRREARIQMSLEHPNVVRTFDLDQLPDGTLYVVMELLQGVSLQEQLRVRSPMPPGVAIPIFLQACRALAVAHRQGVVHRDLKPGNVFLCEGGTVKVLDFGMSKLAQEDALTQDGYTLGTPEYMSPEQCTGGALDARTDLYSFAVMMYEALTGDLPFRSKNRKALLEHHQRTTPRSLRRARPDLDLPEELDHLVLRCLEKNPDKRPPSAEVLERELASIPPDRVRHVYPRSTPRRLSGGQIGANE